ncbi:MAG TPA: PBP1A family penicillin-binding protein [Fimbriimonadaceae bacterium]|nr:PBP1A family penicillin-binding protein [Fimbriimonadaceae bacterium]
MAISTAGQVRTRPRPRSSWKRRVKIAFAILFVILVGGAIWGSLWFNHQLNKAAAKVGSLDKLMLATRIQPTVIMSADGHVLYTMASEYRKPIENLDEVPEKVRYATIAAEDKRFYEHHGVDAFALARAVMTNAREGRTAQGGSTLTMQLAKRVYTDTSKSLQRKVDDIALAMAIEDKLTKDEILLLYLNQVYYGQRAYGIRAAADVYFGKPLDELTIAEAALLARCVRRPSDQNPVVNPKRAIENRDIVLNVMLEEKMITQAEYDEAIAEPLKLRTSAVKILAGIKTAPYFVDWILDQLHDDFPEIDVGKGGYRIETTLNLRIQKEAEKQVKKLVETYRRNKVTTAAFVVMDTQGQVKAMVGGVDYERNQYNIVTQGARQPGSAFKPFVYSAGLELGKLKPSDALSNDRFIYRDPYTGKVTAFKNASGKYGGHVSLRTAVSQSMNMPALRANERTGPSNVVAVAHGNFGFSTRMDAVISLALGACAVRPIEMAQAYSVFALNGDRATPYGIRKIVGQDGQVVKAFQPNIKRNVLSENTVRIMDGLMRAVVTSGTGRRAGSVLNARGKTGTTDSNRDAWFCGYTDELVGIGWIGNEIKSRSGVRKWDYEPMARGTFGGTVTITMWAPIMGAAQKIMGEKRREIREYFPPVGDALPSGITSDETAEDVATGKKDPSAVPGVVIGDGATTEPPSDGATGTEPPPQSRRTAREAEDGEVQLEICADSGLRATRYCPETIRRPFRVGGAPKGTCRLHGP